MNLLSRWSIRSNLDNTNHIDISPKVTAADVISNQYYRIEML